MKNSGETRSGTGKNGIIMRYVPLHTGASFGVAQDGIQICFYFGFRDSNFGFVFDAGGGL